MSKSNNHFAPYPLKLRRRNSNTPSLISASALAGVPEWVRTRCGERVLAEAKRAASIDIEMIEKLDCFIPHTTMAAFLDTVSRKGSVPNLGLVLAPALSLRHYGKWSDYVLGASTLGGSIERVQDSIGFHSHGDHVSLIIDGDLAHFRYRSSARGMAGYSHVAAGAVSVMLSLCRCYLPEVFQPKQVELDIAKPASGFQAFEECFQCPVLFGRPQLAVVFERRALEAGRPADPPVPVTTIEDLARARLEPGERASLLGAIRSQIRTQVLAGSVSQENTAGALQISVRTLQRELNGAGLTYREMVNNLRFERAAELLRDGSLSVSRIAETLGYSNSAHFTRAFRRESGLRPNEYRTKT